MKLRLFAVLSAMLLTVSHASAINLPITDGLLYHLDASDAAGISFDAGNNVFAWNGGNGRVFEQGNIFKAPVLTLNALNGRNALDFSGAGGGDGSELVLDMPTAPQTVIIVNRADTGGGLRGVWGSENADKGIRLNNDTNYRGPNQNSDGNDFANGDPFGVRVNGEFTTAYQVGVPHILAQTRGPNFNATTFNQTSVGEYFAGRAFDGLVSEVVAYDRVLNFSELAQVENALGSFYNIQTAGQTTLPPINVALGKPAQQTSQLGGFSAALGVDGNLGNFTHTLNTDTNPAWQVDLGASIPVEQIVLHNRDSCCQGRLQNINVDILDANMQVVESFVGLNPNNTLGNPEFLTIDLPETATGRFVRVNRTVSAGTNDDARVLSLGEVEVFATNLALTGTAMQSSQLGGFSADNAIDGNLGNFTHTLSSDTSPTLTIDLNGEFDVDSVFLHNRDDCCQSRLQNITVEFLDDEGNTIFTSPLLNQDNVQGGPEFLALDLLDLTGASLRGVSAVQISRLVDLGLPQSDDNRVLSLGEVQVFGSAAAAGVPEPATALLGVLGLAALTRRRRRAVA